MYTRGFTYKDGLYLYSYALARVHGSVGNGCAIIIEQLSLGLNVGNKCVMEKKPVAQN